MSSTKRHEPTYPPPQTQEEQEEYESRVVSELTVNPYHQYRTPRNEKTPHFPTPITQLASTTKLTGNPADPSSHDVRKSFFSTMIAADDVDAIPPTALRIGRIGQSPESDILHAINHIRNQRDFFLKVGFTDHQMYSSCYAGAGAALALNLISNPIERARALAQADFASLSSLQTQSLHSPIDDKIPENTQKVANLASSQQQHQQDSVNTSAELIEKYNNADKLKSTHINNDKRPSTESKGLFGKKRINSSVKLDRSSISPFIQPERRNIYLEYFSKHPNSIRSPLLKPTAYDIFVRRQIVGFDDEFTRLYNAPEYSRMTGMERAMKIRESDLARFEHINFSPYNLYNHQLEFRAPQEVAQSGAMTLGHHKGLDALPPGSPITLQQLDATIIKPIQQDVLPLNQSDFQRGFHRFYLEPRIFGVRDALKKMYLHNGLRRTVFDLYMFSSLRVILPFILLVVMFKPWKAWMTGTFYTDSTFLQEVKMAEVHTRWALSMILPIFPIFTIVSRLGVHKSLLYPQYGFQKDPELIAWKDRFIDFHKVSNTFQKYSMLPQNRGSSSGELTPEQELYRQKENKFLDNLLKKESKRTRQRMIFDQWMVAEGFKSYFRGWRPALYIILMYYVTYITTYPLIGTAMCDMTSKIHQNITAKASLPSPLSSSSSSSSSEHKIVTAIPKNSTFDTQLELMKAIVPFSVASALAHYAAYPFSTIRNYILACDGPGYVAFNKNALPLPRPIVATDQYRLPLRKAEQISTAQQIIVAFHEIRRQAGWRGFWRGASVIPLIRVPQAVIWSSTVFFALNKQWPGSHEIIDAQHFFQYSGSPL